MTSRGSYGSHTLILRQPPSSVTGDYTDVRVVSPYGEIPWARLSRISDAEMGRLMRQVVNRLYTLVLYVTTRGMPDAGLPRPAQWDAPRIDPDIDAWWRHS